jgi:O-antigen/teichoic acid export membrane protein
MTPDHPAPRIRSEAHLFTILGQFAVMQIVVACAGLVRNKVLASRLGPESFGEFAQLAAVVSVACAVVSFGMGVGLSRNAAKAATHEDRHAQLANANGVVLGLSAAALTGGLILLASGRLLSLAGLKEQRAMVIAAAICIAAIPFEAVKSNYLAFLQGILDTRGVATSRSAAVLLATALAVPLIWYFGLIGAAAQGLLLSILVATLLGWRCRVLGYSPLRVRLNPALVATLASFGIVSMASGFAQVFADTAVRARLIASVGASANGVLQAPYVLSELLKGVVLASIGSVALASIAATRERQQVSAEVDRLLNVVLPVGTSALGLLGLLGAPVLTLLYSQQFAAGARLFPYILGADLLLAFVWVIGAPVLAHGDRILWLALDLLYAALRWGVAILLMARLEAVSVVVGYLAAVAVHLSVTLAIYRFRYRLELKPKHLLRLASGIALVAFLSFVGAGVPTSLPLAALGFAAWAAYTVYHARRSELLPALRRRFQKA